MAFYVNRSKVHFLIQEPHDIPPRTYNELWRDAQGMLQAQLEAEVNFEALDRPATTREVSEVYVRYIMISNNLGAAYDLIVQPQKRRLLKKILEVSLGRLLELKQELMRLECNEVINLADMLSAMKLQPNAVELRIPPFFVRHRKVMLDERRQQFTEIYKKLGYIEEEVKEKEVMSTEDAILVIQTSERARQGRLRAQLMKRMRRTPAGMGHRGARTDGQTPDSVASKIQAWWRGHVVRKKVRRQRREEMIFLGMLPPEEPGDEGSNFEDGKRITAPGSQQANKLVDPGKSSGTDPSKSRASQESEARWRQIKEERYRLQLQHESNYRVALVELMSELRETEGPLMSEAFQKEIKEWFLEMKEKEGRLPDLPTEEEGGSAAIFNPAILPPKPVETEKESKKKAKAVSKPSDPAKGSSTGKTKGKPNAAQARRDKGRDQEEAPVEQKMEESKFLEKLREHCFEYQCIWAKRDESWNHDQQHEDVLIKAEKRIDLEREVRIQVDEKMREELEKLRTTMEKDLLKKKKKKERKKRRKKDRKKKKMKDLTPDRTVASLFEELVANGIIKMCPETELSSFIGHFDVASKATSASDSGYTPASLADIRRTIAESCIIPFGSQEVHEKAPIIRSVLIAGPTGSGKKLLVNAIATESGATLFDLTAKNIAGKYPGKSGLVMLMHLLNKVSRLLAPSIIWIDEADKTFIKKVAKGDKTEPRRLKKELPKFVKGIGLEDRVMLLGTTSTPWNFDPKGMAQTYQKVILVPKPEYMTRFTLWQKWICEAVGTPTPIIPCTELARISEGYTPGAIRRVITEVLTRKRVRQLDKKALKPVEFVPALARIEPLYIEEEEAFQQWYLTKTPMGKKFCKKQDGSSKDDTASGPTDKKKSKSKKGKKGKKKKRKK